MSFMINNILNYDDHQKIIISHFCYRLLSKISTKLYLIISSKLDLKIDCEFNNGETDNGNGRYLVRDGDRKWVSSKRFLI